ncbi:MAG: hypothetical protein MI741_10560 [Rhodospirillales bacterium]|nr:hypothetical protein [Rhodospirillales bacterium]
MSKLLNQAQYALYRDVSRAAVNKKVKSGALGEPGEPGSALSEDDKGRVVIDPEIADQLWAANTDPARSKPPKPGPDKGREERDDGQARELTNLNKVKIKKESISVKRAQLDLDEASGVLVRRDDVADATFTALRVVRDSLLAMGPKLAPRLALAKTPKDAALVLNEEAEAVINDLERSFRQLSEQGAKQAKAAATGAA